MRRPTILSLLLIGAMALSASAEPLVQRGRGGRAGRGGAQAISQEEMLENFGDIVGVIMTDEEKDAWGDLDTDEEKQAFIVEFWQRRDPTPETPANEFQETYLGRVTTAMRFFREGGEPGYASDRGKVFVIYGGDAIVQQEQRQVSGAARGGTEIISGGGGDAGDVGGGGVSGGVGQRTLFVWTMDTEDNPYLEGKQEIHFSNIGGRTFSLQTRVELSQDAFLASKSFQQFVADRRANPNAAMRGGGASGGEPAPAMTADFLAMQRLLQQGVTQQDIGLQQERLFFPAPENNTYTVFAFELGKDGLMFGTEDAGGPAQLKAFGLLIQQTEGGEQVVRQMNLDFTAPESRGDARETGAHSFGLTLVPGTYRIAWGVMDAASERITTVSETFEVPNFGSGSLQITSVIAAKSMQPAQEEIDINKVYEGLRVGSIAIDTDLDYEFGRADTFELLYFVMGAAVDPSTQQYQLQVNHRILDEAGNSVARLPEQTLNYFAIGQQIPLGQVSAIQSGASYSVEINVRDLVSGQEVTKLVPFSVAVATDM